MVLKKMLVEEDQDACLVHGHLLCVNGMNLLFLSLYIDICLPSSLCSREYMVWKNMLFEEFQDGCFVLGYLWYANGVILVISGSPFCRKVFIMFLIKRIYELEEDVG